MMTADQFLTNLLSTITRCLATGAFIHAEKGLGFKEGRPYEVAIVRIPQDLIDLYADRLEYNITYDKASQAWVITVLLEAADGEA